MPSLRCGHPSRTGCPAEGLLTPDSVRDTGLPNVVPERSGFYPLSVSHGHAAFLRLVSLVVGFHIESQSVVSGLIVGFVLEAMICVQNAWTLVPDCLTSGRLEIRWISSFVHCVPIVDNSATKPRTSRARLSVLVPKSWMSRSSAFPSSTGISLSYLVIDMQLSVSTQTCSATEPNRRANDSHTKILTRSQTNERTKST